MIQIHEEARVARADIHDIKCHSLQNVKAGYYTANKEEDNAVIDSPAL